MTNSLLLNNIKHIVRILILTICFYSKAYSQNLVPNPSFENYDTCPTSSSQISFAIPWQGITTNSSDYFNSCNIGGPSVPLVGGGGFQYARTGNAYAGVWLVNGYYSNYREYIRVKLNSSLELDSCYLIEFYCNLHNLSRYGINKIGALLSNSPVNNVGPGPFDLVLQYSPQIESNMFLNDTLNWMKISARYTALGGEEYITIGNFRTDILTDTIHVGGSNYNGSYYFIEDVRVEKIPNCDSTLLNIEANKKNYNLKLYPNPNDGRMNFVYDLVESEKGELVIYDISGRTIQSFKLQIGTNNQLFIDETKLGSGVYFYKVLINEKITTSDKLIIIK